MSVMIFRIAQQVSVSVYFVTSGVVRFGKDTKKA